MLGLFLERGVSRSEKEDPLLRFLDISSRRGAEVIEILEYGTVSQLEAEDALLRRTQLELQFRDLRVSPKRKSIVILQAHDRKMKRTEERMVHGRTKC